MQFEKICVPRLSIAFDFGSGAMYIDSTQLRDPEGHSPRCYGTPDLSLLSLPAFRDALSGDVGWTDMSGTR